MNKIYYIIFKKLAIILLVLLKLIFGDSIFRNRPH